MSAVGQAGLGVSEHPGTHPETHPELRCWVSSPALGGSCHPRHAACTPLHLQAGGFSLQGPQEKGTGTELRSKYKLQQRHREAARLEHLTQFPFIKVKSRAPHPGPERWPRPPLPVRSSCPTKGESGQEGGVHGDPLGEAAGSPGSPETSGQAKG